MQKLPAHRDSTPVFSRVWNARFAGGTELQMVFAVSRSDRRNLHSRVKSRCYCFVPASPADELILVLFSPFLCWNRSRLHRGSNLKGQCIYSCGSV